MAATKGGGPTARKAALHGRLLLRQAGRFEPPVGASHELEPKDALLLAHLAIEGPTPRAKLAAMLWPEVDDERARGNLRQRLLRLKRVTNAQLLTGDAQVQLAAGIGHDLADTHELLEAVDPEAASGFAEWLTVQRERRRRKRSDALFASAAQAEAQGDLAAALRQAGALLDLDPLSEDAHRRLIKLHYLRGDTGAALAAYRRCVEVLRAELGAQPSRETRELGRQIELAAPVLPVATAPRALPVTILRPPRLIGREAELLAMAQAWETGVAFLLQGEAGMGKSRALTEFAQTHARVTLVQARPGDSGVPYATLARLLRTAMAGKLPALADGSRTQLARVLPELRPASVAAPDRDRPEVQPAIEAVLLDAWREGLRGILLDDLQFADEASVEMLRTMLGGERDIGLRWGFAQRPGEPIVAAQSLRDTLEDALGLHNIALVPLGVAQMAALVDSLGLPDLDGGAIAERLVRHTGGNPMFALETLKHVLVAGGTDAQLPRPTSVGALIERRLRQLSPPAIALARVAAVAGVDFSIEMAEHVLKTPAVALADAWNELESAQVLKGTAFAHDLVFEAALRSMPEAIATHTHGSIAEWLERAEGEPARIAAHWEATTAPQRALPWLRKAAERAFDAMRPREAIEFLVRAAALEANTATPSQAFASLASVVDNRIIFDSGTDLRPLLDQLDALAVEPRDRVHALQSRVDHHMIRKERLDEALALQQRAVALATEVGWDWLRVAGALNVAVLHASLGDHEDAARVTEDLLPEARRWPVLPERCTLLAKAGYVFNRAGQLQRGVALFEESIAEALACGSHAVAISALGHVAHARLRLGQPEKALDAIARTDALCAAHDGIEGASDSNHYVAAMVLRLLGRYDEALARVHAAMGVARARVAHDLSSTFVVRAELWLDLGQTARALQDRALAEREVRLPIKHQELTLLDLRLAAEANVQSDQTQARGRALLAEGSQLFMQLVGKLRRATFAAPAEALVIARDAVAEARQAGFRGLEASAMSRAAVAEIQAGDVDGAVTHARLAVELADGQGTDDLSWPAIVRNAATVLQQAGLTDEARQLVARGTAWLRDTAERHVPPEFREGFLNRNPVNLELHRLAIRLG
jgi:DNA-binding SARP family transcriptional activator/tetratricopeptide (TPR) repeat protein